MCSLLVAPGCYCCYVAVPSVGLGKLALCKQPPDFVEGLVVPQGNTDPELQASLGKEAVSSLLLLLAAQLAVLTCDCTAVQQCEVPVICRRAFWVLSGCLLLGGCSSREGGRLGELEDRALLHPHGVGQRALLVSLLCYQFLLRNKWEGEAEKV